MPVRFSFSLFALALFGASAAWGVPDRLAEIREHEPAPTAAMPDLAMVDMAGSMDSLGDEFGLTPAQRVQLALLLRGYGPQMMDGIEALVSGRVALNDALAADVVDADRIAALAASQAGVLGELAVLRVDATLAVRNLLTPEQRALLDELRQRIRDAIAAGIEAGGARIERGAASRVAVRRGGAATGDPIRDAAAILGLSATQRAEVRRIVEAAIPEVLALGAEVASNRQAIGDLIRADTVDRDAIDARLASQTALYETLILVRVDVALQLRDVLDADQLALIQHLRAAIQRQLMDGLGL